MSILFFFNEYSWRVNTCGFSRQWINAVLFNFFIFFGCISLEGVNLSDASSVKDDAGGGYIIKFINYRFHLLFQLFYMYRCDACWYIFYSFIIFFFHFRMKKNSTGVCWVENYAYRFYGCARMTAGLSIKLDIGHAFYQLTLT